MIVFKKMLKYGESGWVFHTASQSQSQVFYFRDFQLQRAESVHMQNVFGMYTMSIAM